MEQIKLYYSKKEQTNLYLNLLVYVIFFVYSLSLIISKPDEPFTWFISLIAFVFLALSLLMEFIKYHFKKAIYLLTIQRDPSAGLTQIAYVEKFDLLKSFKSACHIFRILALLDLHESDTLNVFLDQISTNQTKDLVLVKAYALFKIQIFKQNKTQMKKAYANLIVLKDIKNKGKRVFNALFSWEDIQAEYEYLINDYKKANSFLNSANTAAMNPRELDQHNLIKAKVLEKLGKSDEALSIYNDIAITSNMNAYGKEAVERRLALEAIHENA